MKRLLVILMLFVAAPAWAMSPSEMLNDPALEARAREIGKGLRCLVCQSESVDDSESEFARDVRALVRERVKAGDTDAAVVAALRARYGDFILLDPPVAGRTWLLWLTPAFVFLGGLAAVGFKLSSSKNGRESDPAS